MMVTGSPSAGENATQVKSRESDQDVGRYNIRVSKSKHTCTL